MMLYLVTSKGLGIRKLCKRFFSWYSSTDIGVRPRAIKGVALDTYEHEVGVFTTDRRGEDLNDELLNSLIQREDIIITLHIAFYTEAAVENLIVDALDAAMDVINTGDTRLRVN